MWKVLILICEITVPRADCQIGTARDYFYAPDVQDMVTCGLHAQALAAETLPAATIARIEAGLSTTKPAACQLPQSAKTRWGRASTAPVCNRLHA
jgi:hypothetical protein